MSRLKKKIPAGDKKKKKEDADIPTDNSVSTPSFSSSKSAAVASPLKSKLEKSLAETQSREPNLIQKSMEFFREVKVELKKVTWPTRKQTTGTTIVVIVFVFVVAAFLGLFDFGLSKLVQVVLT
ncbi:preprotein translocase subunit SecE [Desulfobacula sp.]|uniref:preprotein translocase subunit SecE n=1 Tax=Desulfobacula sp. TaxID=2593537 RepID=UPI00260E7469|nr:preprotein translocase subunit SecE [Desulfobacula sp.]